MLKKLYEKSEIWFAVVWIIAYVILASTGDNVSAEIGIPKLVTLPILLALSGILCFYVRKNGLAGKYGLCKPRLPAAKMLFYIPLLVLLTANLWYGVAMNMSPPETVLYVLSMFCVGFLEELIFRGLLFQAMTKEGVKAAVTIRELEPGKCKISLRTDPADLNASTVCGLLGGGGHAAASGATVEGSVEFTKIAILNAIHQVKAADKE